MELELSAMSALLPYDQLCVLPFGATLQGKHDEQSEPMLVWMPIHEISFDWKMTRSVLMALGSKCTLESFDWPFMCRQILSKGALAVHKDVSGIDFGSAIWQDVVVAAKLSTVAGLRDYLRKWKSGVDSLSESSNVCVEQLNRHSYLGAWLSDYLMTIYRIALDEVHVSAHYSVVTNHNYTLLVRELLSVHGMFPELAELATMTSEVRIGNIMERLSWQAVEEHNHLWLIGVIYNLRWVPDIKEVWWSPQKQVDESLASSACVAEISNCHSPGFLSPIISIERSDQSSGSVAKTWTISSSQEGTRTNNIDQAETSLGLSAASRGTQQDHPADMSMKWSKRRWRWNCTCVLCGVNHQSDWFQGPSTARPLGWSKKLTLCRKCHV